MWPTLRTFWRSLSGKAPRKDNLHRRTHVRRPFLEALEDRTVPASLSWSTYFHGSIFGTAVDSAGNVYVTGTTDPSLPTTPGAFETSGSGAFAAKFSTTGALVYATYLGNGTSLYNDSGYGIAVDAAGDAYVIGNNPNVPTTPNAIASSPYGPDGWQAMFVAELNPTGSGLVYSSYFPGAAGLAATYGNAACIAVDASGNIYVAGGAFAGLPVTAGAFQTTCLGSTGNTNAFFAKINPALSGMASVLYASYLGGSGWDGARGIALDSAGDAYLTGYASDSNFPTTSGAFQTTYGGGATDTFVAKFNPALSGSASLVYSTYLGGSGDDSCLLWSGATLGGIAVDSAGNAYVTGSTSSTNFPTTSGAYQPTSNIVNPRGTPLVGRDVFVTKLNATGTALVYSTYIGGGGSKKSLAPRSGGSAIAVDANGDAELTGWTNSTTFPTKNPLQATNGGGYDAFVTVLNPAGSSLLFSSYFGGSDDDNGCGIALDSAGNAYVGGGTVSTNFPTTPGAYQTSPGGGFVLKIDPPADEGTVPPAAVFPSLDVPPMSREAISGTGSFGGLAIMSKLTAVGISTYFVDVGTCVYPGSPPPNDFLRLQEPGRTRAVISSLDTVRALPLSTEKISEILDQVSEDLLAPPFSSIEYPVLR
jgi:hypothetical protein